MPYDNVVASALVHQGVIPCSLITPTVVITIQALELYHISYYHNPHFSIRHIQFSIAFDVYLQLIANVDSLVDKVLHCNSPNWHLKHCCLACTYTLEGEQPLQFSIQYALDGNDSLKHIQCKLLSEDSEGWSTSIELPTCQVLTCNQHLSCKFVDQCVFVHMSDYLADLDLQDSEVNPCAGCWKNMDDQKTKKTWGVYKETGIMLAVCRHGFSVLIADMPFTHSSSTKHPLTIISKLLEVVGKDFGSPLGLLACSLNHTCLVSTFDGHAH
ncbi:hypothetical protein EDD17DRAFT_1777172 [Pisolithus thermaeus]|nr:hypothetical protein EDD17DRAFT_1777172 [Pisolithus thermaeus]